MIDFYFWPTPNAYKVAVMLAEIGIPYRVMPINILEGEQHAPEFLDINPNGKVPAIVDPDGPDGKPIAIFESGAILLYLAEKTGKLLPTDSVRRYEALQWLMFQMGGFGPMLGQAHHFRVYAPEQIDYAVERYTREASAEGQQVVHRLVQKADVVVENYKFGDLARYGLDYDSLAASNPAIVYCSITGYGQTGPYRERAGYDMAIQAISGLMSITGERQDRPGGGPQKVGVPIADLMTGTMSAAAVIAAYHHARKTGEGQSVDMALLDVMVTTLANQNMNYLCTGDAPRLMGNAHPNIVPYRTFQTADGNFVLAVGNDRQYAKFCEAAGCRHLATDPRYIDNANRLKNRETLEAELQDILCLKPTAQWIDELSRLGIPCAPINTLDQVFSDEQIRARDLLQHAEHKHNARMPIVSSPIKLSRTRLDTGSAAPVLNQHRDYILDEVLGLSDDEKTRLAKGIPV